MIEKFTNFFIFILNKFCDFYFKRQHHSKFFRKSVVLFCLKFSLNLLQYETKKLISKKILIHAKFTEESGLYFFPKYYLINHKKKYFKIFHPSLLWIDFLILFEPIDCSAQSKVRYYTRREKYNNVLQTHIGIVRQARILSFFPKRQNGQTENVTVFFSPCSH